MGADPRFGVRLAERMVAVKIAVFGAGGIGGYFGGRLAQAGHDVTFIARGAHLSALRENGLRVRSVRGDFTVDASATDDPGDVGPCDAVLFCVKSYDTDAAASRLPPLLAEGTAVVTLQNGVDNEDKIASVVGRQHVLGGVALISVALAEPGTVVDTGGPGQILFGELDGARTKRVDELLTACREAGIDADVPPDIRVVLWSKFVFICALAGMTAATRRPLGEIRDCPESWKMFGRILREVEAVGRAEGMALADDLVEDHLRLTAALEPDMLSSLHHDLATGHRMELDALHGVVVRLARKHRIPVPACGAVYALLRPSAIRNEAS